MTSKPGSPRAFIMFLLATTTTQATLWHVSQNYHRRVVNHAVGNKTNGFPELLIQSKTNWGFEYAKRFSHSTNTVFKQEEEMIEISLLCIVDHLFLDEGTITTSFQDNPISTIVSAITSEKALRAQTLFWEFFFRKIWTLWHYLVHSYFFSDHSQIIFLPCLSLCNAFAITIRNSHHWQPTNLWTEVGERDIYESNKCLPFWCT